MTRMIRSAVMIAACAMAAPTSLSAQQDQMKHGKDAMASTPMMGQFTPFSRPAFDAARAAGKTTMVFFHAPWCSVCKAQEPKVVARLAGSSRHVVAFKADYDSNTALRTEMNVAKQSTLILFKGTNEVARLSYKSDDASIDEFFGHTTMSMPAGNR